MVIYFLNYTKKHRLTPKEDRDFGNWLHLFYLFTEYSKSQLLKTDGYFSESGYQCDYYIFRSEEGFAIAKEQYPEIICVDYMEEFLEFKEEIVFKGKNDYHFREGYGE